MIGWPKPKKKGKAKYTDSKGSQYTQSMIDVRLRQAYEDNPMNHLCECCHKQKAIEHSHIISQKRCKELHITEMIWQPLNWTDSCRDCHTDWEGYKSGKFAEHRNVFKTMSVLKAYDPEAFRKRINYIKDQELLNQLL